MKYDVIGNDASAAEITDISPFGIWLLYGGTECFLSFEEFPWFRNAPVSQVFFVVEEGPEHLRWPGLDVDLSRESIRKPKQFPLVSEPPATYGDPKSSN
jgi:hypothetical protein